MGQVRTAPPRALKQTVLDPASAQHLRLARTLGLIPVVSPGARERLQVLRVPASLQRPRPAQRQLPQTAKLAPVALHSMPRPKKHESRAGGSRMRQLLRQLPVLAQRPLRS
jgi:hypothetical protein